ncbi:tRNA (guanine37-N1)-methyltransferase [Entomoplasma freundtii]|uniref:tRNA (guanine-N(1)-)-methyltransferase n=1 Tax=Entomoplasma freundtii TaxID=74700 RepID=A0A2K8NRE9_9MOLU|nr:tRNA (guanosine(37)-N1)-methyltransferase TrmD [Entomoplasma freundtii]ATZ16420.1 tRNA (guanosine(37)-N1)-methyltransferase [Entomoplasma freundtii]TDY56541.1 tRNA (guanine37-N1)-methyltransferase [Entomoplasma freundtii]
MKYTIITLFPKIIAAYLEESIIKRAIQRHLIEVEVVDLRDYTTLSHHQVDDYQFGGGAGMVLMVEPLVKALEAVKTPKAKVCLLTPQGKTWDQKAAQTIIGETDHLILICGHYEGFDERFLKYVDLEISVGDYVLTGGELASLVVLDSTTRLIPNVVNPESISNESFQNHLLDYPVYTKPVDFRGDQVPAVLLSGHHAEIQKFREEQQLLKTWQKRPDLIVETKLTTNQVVLLKKLKKKGAK